MTDTRPKAKREKAERIDDIRDDIGESLERRGIHDPSLLRELMETFGVHLGQEKYRIERQIEKENHDTE